MSKVEDAKTLIERLIARTKQQNMTWTKKFGGGYEALAGEYTFAITRDIFVSTSSGTQPGYRVQVSEGPFGRGVLEDLRIEPKNPFSSDQEFAGLYMPCVELWNLIEDDSSNLKKILRSI